MSRNIIAFVAGALLLSPVVAHATVMQGDFSGTIDSPSGGTDVTGVFGPASTDLSGDAVTGTFVYDTSLLSQVVTSTTNNATGSPGALTVTMTINGHSFTFTDQSSSSINLDTSASDANISTNNSTGGHGDTFTLDASDIINTFITSTDLTATWTTTNPLISDGSFVINDSGPQVTASGTFSLGTFEVTGQVATPEPASIALLGVGLAGISTIRRRRAGTR